MPTDPSYMVPAQTVREEYEVKRSRFIATVGRVTNGTQAKEFIEKVRSEFPDATHHCYGYVAGNPNDTTDIGLGDDGEVPGTAGKPILSILQHKGIGEVIAVVTRYFGGTKLGTGGLVRAYSTALNKALDSLELTPHFTLSTAAITIPYKYENAVRLLLGKMNIAIERVDHTDSVRLTVNVSDDVSDKLRDEIMNHTHGEATYEPVSD